MKQISVIGKEVENKNGQQPCKLLVTSFDTNDLGGFQLLDLIITELKSHMTC